MGLTARDHGTTRPKLMNRPNPRKATPAMPSHVNHPASDRRPAARLAGLALAAVLGAAGVAAPLSASAEESVPEAVATVESPVEAPAGPGADASQEPPAGQPDAGSAEVPTEEPAQAPEEPAAEATEGPVEAPPTADGAAREASDGDGPAGDAPAASQSLKAEGPQGFANTAPVAVDDHWQMLQDTTLTVNEPGMQGNDYDAEGDWFRINQHTWPVSGALEFLNGGPGFRYTPEPGFTGTASFDYKVGSDAAGGSLQSEWATVTIDVLPTGSEVASPPVASDDTYLYTPGKMLYIADFQGLLVNDQLDGQPVVSLEMIYGSQIGNGEIAITGTGGGFLADAGDAPPQSYHRDYRVCTAVACDDGTLWLYPTDEGVEPSGPDSLPESPVAVADAYGVMQDTPLVVAAPGFLANDIDSEPGDTLEAIIDDSGMTGTLTTAPGGGFGYTPAPGFTGLDDFYYRVRDSHGYLSEWVQVELQIGDGSVNHRPIAADDHYLVRAGEALYIPAPGGLANDSDPDGDAVLFGGTGDAGLGDLAWPSGGYMVYTPPAGFVGTDTWSYWPVDEHGLGAALDATVTFEVVPSDGAANTPPVPVQEAYVVEAGQTLAVPASGVLANDLDADGDALAVLQSFGAYKGDAALAADGGFTYTPPAGYLGTDWIEYQITDGASRVTARTRIVVYEGAEPAVGVEDAYTAVSGETVEVQAPGVLGNDHVPAGWTAAVTAVTKATGHGTVTFHADGSFSYASEPGFVGKDQFHYEFRSGDDVEYPAVVITVTEPGDEEPGEGGDPGTGEPGTGGPGTGQPGTGGPSGSDGGQEGSEEPGRPETPQAAPAAAPVANSTESAGGGSALADTGADGSGAAAVSAIALVLGALALLGARLRRKGTIG